MLPGLLAICTPIIVGFGFSWMGFNGAEVLASVLAGVAVSGVLMALFQSNAGGAWDNAKKSFEKGVEIDGKMYYKGSDPHKAAVTGDTVGDPFKDTSGPSMNILIKLTAIVSLVIAPLLYKANESKILSAKAITEKMHTVHLKAISADIKTVNGLFPVDNSHSFVEFTIKHWMARARGTMMVDSGSVNMTGDPATSSLKLWLNANSFNTSDLNRDAKMKTEDWFDAAKHPQIVFNSTSFGEQPDSAYRYVAHGELTIKGITKPVSIPFNYLGETKTQYVEKIISFEGQVTINRVDFKVGGANLPFLSDDATITFSLEAAK